VNPASHRAVDSFRANGFVILPDLFDVEEIDLLRRMARNDDRLHERAVGRRDAAGGIVRLSLANRLSDDLYSAFVRCARLVGVVQELLGDEVYHWHHKMILKEPFVGGAWEWHQDYGYWYKDACLYPELASCFVAVDPATRANGCLQLLRGSHALGRLDHGPIGDQTGADPERVEAALERHERVYAEMAPGDALIFHANTLHRSDRNASADPRWALIACYNTRRNSPYRPARHPSYTPLDVLPDERVREIGRRAVGSIGMGSGGSEA
jgi:ectoine hydroxylase